jgi:AcrR family transcriptional regulator
MMQMTGVGARQDGQARHDLQEGGVGTREPSPGTGRPRKRGRLSRELVLSAALELVDQEGLDRLSMRRLASKLGVEAMALYRHAANKQELLGGLIDRVLSELRVDPSAYEDWEEGLREGARDFRRVVLAHPNIFPLLITRPFSIPLSRRPPTVLMQFETMLKVFEQAGFSPGEALVAYQILGGYLLGHLLIELRRVIEDPDEPEPALSLGLYRLPARQFPRVRQAAILLMDQDVEATFETGLETILDGLRRQVSMVRERAAACADGQEGEHSMAPRTKAMRGRS